MVLNETTVVQTFVSIWLCTKTCRKDNKWMSDFARNIFLHEFFYDKTDVWFCMKRRYGFVWLCTKCFILQWKNVTYLDSICFASM